MPHILRGFRTAAAAAAAIAVTATPVAVQSPAGTMTFDFRVVAEDGTPVTGLQPADVTLHIGGKPRTITKLDAVSAGAAAARTAAPGAGPAPATPPFATNTASAAARPVLLVIDDESVTLGRDRPLKDALKRLAGSLVETTQVGLVSVRRTGATNVAPTRDAAVLDKAIDGLQPQSGDETAEAFRCRTLTAIQGLEAVLRTVGAEAPVDVVFVSASLEQPNSGAGRVGQSSDLCRLVPDTFERIGSALAGSRAQMFVVHYPDGTARSGSESAPGVESIAGVVGTDTLRLTGNGEALTARLLKELRSYYVATFEADPSDRMAPQQRVELRVAKPGAHVHARPQVHLARLAPGAGGGGKTSPRDMIRTAATFRDLPLRAWAYTSRNPGDDKAKVVVLFEPDAAGTKITAASVGLFSGDTLKAQWTAQESDFARAPVMAALTVPRGAYRMRVAAVDASGRSGTVDVPLKAEPIAAGPMQLSTPLLGGMSKSGFAPKLLFAAGDAAAVSYLEAFNVPKGAAVTATLELAPSEEAPAMGTTDAQVRPGATDDARIIVGGFGIENLAPGDYVVRTVISVDGKPVGRAASTLRKAGS